MNSGNQKSNKKALFASLVVLGFFVPAIIFFTGERGESIVSKKDFAPTKINSNKIFQNLELEAKSAIVWDIGGQKEIFGKNAEIQLPLASLSKVMMALVSLEHAPGGAIISIKEDDLLEEGDSGLFLYERWRLRDLIDFSLAVSSNDGAKAIAGAVGSLFQKETPLEAFVGLMNKKAGKLGLVQTYFTSPSGLDKDDIISGGNGSVRDMAVLFEYVLKNKPEIFKITAYPESVFNSLDFSHEEENTNSGLLKKLPGVIASKTGFTDLAGGNLFVVFEPEPMRQIILGVLGSSLLGRFSDIEKLYLTTLDYLEIFE